MAWVIASDLGGVAGWVDEVFEAAGEAGFGALMFSESFVLPLPSAVVLSAAGYVAALGRAGFVATVVAATLGNLTGALVWHRIGRAVGRDRLARLARLVPFISSNAIDRAWATFGRWERSIVFWGRLLPGPRIYLSIPAGAAGMSLGPFLVLSAAGAAIYNTGLMGAGWWLAERYGATATAARWINIATWISMAVWIASALIGRYRARAER